MTRAVGGGLVVDVARDWARDAAEAAVRVPATGTEAADWTVRGWAEVALGCLAIGAPDALRGLDEVVAAARVPCGGPFAARLRVLRGAQATGGDLPPRYFANAVRAPVRAVMTAPAAAACVILAEYCDALAAAVMALGPGRAGPAPGASLADHLRWGEWARPSPAGSSYEVLPVPAEQSLGWRSWMCLPGASGRRIALVDAAGRPSASTRQRVCHGIHNGAHLDHLGALASADRGGTWTHAPVEFGTGLLAAESYAMAVELLAAAECVLAERSAEARQLLTGFVERIGRIPGYRAWYERHGRYRGSAALAGAATVRVAEFATLPTLAVNYVTGPLRLIARGPAGPGGPDPLLPGALDGLLRQRWAAAAARFPAAAALARRAASLE